MKQFTQLKSWLTLCLMIVSMVTWGEETPAYTLSFRKLTSGTNYNSYSGSHDITCSNISWTVFGNQSQGDFLRVGGNNKTATNRSLTSNGKISAEKSISKITISHSGVSNGKNTEITINSITVEGSTSSSFTTKKSKTIIAPSVKSGTLEFILDEGNWDANSYYKILVNCQVKITSGNSANNCYITIDNVKFYTADETPSHSVRFSVNGCINDYNDCTVKEGAAITFPTDPADIDGKKFVGWTTTKFYFNADNAPSDLCTEAMMGENDIVYYAVFAHVGDGPFYSYYTTNPLFTITTTDTDFYSLYLDHAVTIPGNVTAYKGRLDGFTLNLEPIEGTIPANTGVLFKTEAAGEANFVACNDVATLDNNDIKGVAEETTIANVEEAGKKVLVLGLVDGKVGFAQPAADATTIAANKAYILVPTSSGSAPAVRLLLDDETGIEAIPGAIGNKLQTTGFNLQGQRVEATAKGIVIVNGKKVFNKSSN